MSKKAEFSNHTPKGVSNQTPEASNTVEATFTNSHKISLTNGSRQKKIVDFFEILENYNHLQASSFGSFTDQMADIEGFNTFEASKRKKILFYTKAIANTRKDVDAPEMVDFFTNLFTKKIDGKKLSKYNLYRFLSITSKVLNEDAFLKLEHAILISQCQLSISDNDWS